MRGLAIALVLIAAVAFAAFYPQHRRFLQPNLARGSSSCTPTTCVALGATCGTASDGCGGTLSCGSCTAPQYCSANACADPQFSFADSTGRGMTTECDGGALATVQAT